MAVCVKQIGEIKLRLGVIRLRYDPFGGAERIIERTIRKLCEADLIEQVVIFSEEWSSAPIESLDKKIVLQKIPVHGITRFRRHLNFQANVLKSIKKYPQIDILQSHERITGCNIFRAGDGVHRAWVDRLCSSKGSLGRLIIKNDPFHRLMCDREVQMAQDERTTFIANSPLSQEEILGYLNVPKDRVRLIPNSLDVKHWQMLKKNGAGKREARRRFGLDPDKPCIVFVGSGFNRKGLAPLIEALSQWPDAQLLVVGKDRRWKDYVQLAEKLMAGRAIFAGPLSTAVPDALAASDVFALPSVYDSFSNACLEALSFGLPIVVTADTGIAHFIEKYGGGIISTRDSEDLSSALKRAYLQKDEMGLNATNTAVLFDHDRILPHWISLYEEIVGKFAH